MSDLSLLNSYELDVLEARWNSTVFGEGKYFRHLSLLTAHEARETFKWLMLKYQEPHRSYHNLNHLLFLLRCSYSDTLYANKAKHREFLVKGNLFIFFHDCIYNIPALDNEESSAKEAEKRMQLMGFNSVITDFVCSTIRLSNHTEKCDDSEQQLLLDYDLAVLGGTPQEYQQYAQDIRNEYGVVSQDVWVEKRGDFLMYMLNKESIFQHPTSIAKYELQARMNLKAELESLNRNYNTNT